MTLLDITVKSLQRWKQTEGTRTTEAWRKKISATVIIILVRDQKMMIIIIYDTMTSHLSRSITRRGGTSITSLELIIRLILRTTRRDATRRDATRRLPRARSCNDRKIQKEDQTFLAAVGIVRTVLTYFVYYDC
jgi:uncharacterized membrane protein